MCTILFAFKKHPEFPLIVAANRDEFYGRPTAGPSLVTSSPRILAGRDLEHGGTWMGLNEHGLFVGLTNRRSSATDRRSRGELVLNALELSGPAEVEEMLRSEASGSQFRPFNLLFGTREDLRVAHAPDGQLDISPMEPGIHVLPSGGQVDDVREPRVARGLFHLEDALAMPSSLMIARLDQALRDGHVPELQRIPDPGEPLPFDSETWRKLHAINVSTPRYGTRSSTIVMLGDQEIQYYYADRDENEQLQRVDHLLKART